MLVKTGNGFGQQRCSRQNHELVAGGADGKPKRWHGVCDDDPINRGIG